MTEYDAIVVGAGNGGLTAALTLAGQGARTLLLERHNIPGGCATSFCRGHFEFEVALHQLSGIRTEVFGPPARVTDHPGWPAAVGADQRFSVAIAGRPSVSVAAGEPLMIGLERNRIVLPALCRSGECSLCRTRLVRGEAFQPAGVKVRASDRTCGYIHPCMAYPVSDLEIELPG